METLNMSKRHNSTKEHKTAQWASTEPQLKLIEICIHHMKFTTIPPVIQSLVSCQHKVYEKNLTRIIPTDGWLR